MNLNMFTPERKLKNALLTLRRQGCNDLAVLNGESAKSLKKKFDGIGPVSAALIIVHCRQKGIYIKIDDAFIAKYVDNFEQELAK